MWVGWGVADVGWASAGFGYKLQLQFSSPPWVSHSTGPVNFWCMLFSWWQQSTEREASVFLACIICTDIHLAKADHTVQVSRREEPHHSPWGRGRGVAERDFTGEWRTGPSHLPHSLYSSHPVTHSFLFSAEFWYAYCWIIYCLFVFCYKIISSMTVGTFSAIFTAKCQVPT